MFAALLFPSFILSSLQLVLAASRTTPPAGAVVVRAGTTTAGEFSTITAALNSLPNDSSSRSLFIFPGTYTEQIDITRSGPLTIYGYTTDTTTYTSNQATIAFNSPANVAGSDDASGTLRIHKNNFSMYNVNVRNTFGPGVQAIALSQYGSEVGLYACGFYGYQDTLYANEGTQVYLKNYIEGGIDFIFGREGSAYFGGNTIGVLAAGGSITASGRQTNDSGSYVFHQNTIVLGNGAASGTAGSYYFGRPWSDWARVIFESTVLEVAPNPAVWSLWDGNATSIDHVINADYNTTGPGATNLKRASWAEQLTASQAAQFSISSAVGSTWQSWVDLSYFV
ncbi:carbohydrate esterase family 8 protein [Collybiopsis luxurians FD-317 M1]|uniref:pectinesterase n=1 Tax=Collybiopsis luxurians FD-317 M1 TaxID=944289 RepID=A0A0D0D427_9AGAR|nr:carbohydrate esterase family 8 protein [Collybiopsis luxurians FD-317 M1]